MPDETITESWRVITVRSLALTFFVPMLISIERPVAFLSSFWTVSPRDLSSLVIASAFAPEISPLWGTPVMSVAWYLKTAEAAMTQTFARLASNSPGVTVPVLWTSRRSSSGSAERVRAVAMSMVPARTRPARLASIVCMPCEPPVWIRE